MRPDNADLGYIWDMLQAAQEVMSFTRDVDSDSFMGDVMRLRAVERSIQNLGEAANHVDPTFRTLHPQLPWREITSQRHVLVHEYGEIDPKRIWLVATREVPAIIPVLEGILALNRAD